MRTRSLPVLEDLRVATPCNESWDAMTGDERARHCASCDKDVFDLSGFSRDEAVAFVKKHTGRDVCVRFYKRHDGTVLTSDCPVGIARARRRLVLAAAAVLSFFGFGAVAAATMGKAAQCDLGGDGGGVFTSSPTVQAVTAIFSAQPIATPPIRAVMGKMVYRPPVTPSPGNNSGGNGGSNP